MNPATSRTPALVIDFEHEQPHKQDQLLTHITNLLRDLDGQELSIQVVAYGPGVHLLVTKDTGTRDRIAGLQSRGVLFCACRNAMNSYGIQDGDLLAGVVAVPSGVGRIVKAQLEGSKYLKS